MITLHFACLPSYTVALSDQKNQVKQLSYATCYCLGRFKVILERFQPNSFKGRKYALLMLLLLPDKKY